MRSDVEEVTTAAAAGGATLLTLAAGQFLMTLDSSVMNVSIATVADDLGTDVTGAGAEITTLPMLLAGLGVGALASQLGAVTVSSVSDELSGEVGGLQNTLTNLGASIGTALAGAVLISALTSSVLAGLSANDDVPDEVAETANVELASGVPFISDKDLVAALDDAGVPEDTADAIVEENEAARLDALRAALGVLAVATLLAAFASRRLPTDPPGGGQAATAGT